MYRYTTDLSGTGIAKKESDEKQVLVLNHLEYNKLGFDGHWINT